MKNRVLVGALVAGVVMALRGVGAQHAAPLPTAAPLHTAEQDRVLTARDSALHALNRLTYGPRPGEADRIAATGVMTWIDHQLDPQTLDDGRLAQRERRFPILDYDRSALARLFLEAQRERRARRRQGATDGGPDSAGAQHAAPLPATMSPSHETGRRLGGQLQQLAVVRAALSERQLYEVMVDFWTNHFNVFFGKGADRFLMPDYIERTIRPRALGRFADLLIATAQSPAMLFYLDNWQSVAPGSATRGGQGPRAPKGLNENYARELLELHTLGVDGGYTQQDVVQVARLFTGWSLRRPQQGADFEFREWAHDYGEKQVLGVGFQGGRGMEEGIRLLELLANHPATMHHLSRKLCQRFVNDDPPDGCVDDAVAAWKRTDGDIREVLRAIVRGPDFWAPENARAKVKTPLEFVVSALRAVNGEPDTAPRLAQVVARLGQPLFLHVAPDGYAEREDAWVNSGALLDRMNVAVALAAGKLPGATGDLDAIVAPTADHARLIAAVDERILGRAMSEHTKDVIRRQISDVGDPVQARALAVGLAIGGPEFQRQ